MEKVITILILIVILSGCTTGINKNVVVTECPELEEPSIPYLTRLDIYYKRWQVCDDYKSTSGDYTWRHKWCKGAEREYLELFSQLNQPSTD